MTEVALALAIAPACYAFGYAFSYGIILLSGPRLYRLFNPIGLRGIICSQNDLLLQVTGTEYSTIKKIHNENTHIFKNNYDVYSINTYSNYIHIKDRFSDIHPNLVKNWSVFTNLARESDTKTIVTYKDDYSSREKTNVIQWCEITERSIKILN